MKIHQLHKIINIKKTLKAAWGIIGESTLGRDISYISCFRTGHGKCSTVGFKTRFKKKIIHNFDVTVH